MAIGIKSPSGIKSIVGNYRIVRELGSGGMGAVYEAVDLMLERPVALKMLRAEIARQPELIERFRAEAVTLAKLNHPSIATLYSFFREDGEYYMVMEFVRGRTLEAVLREAGRLAPAAAAGILRQTLDGMAHAHAMGVLHRDIKPANIMLTGAGGDPGTVKVTDFGIARILGSSRMTREGRVVGTLEYIAPERIRGEEADIRSDLYSAGVVLYETLAGRLPFVSDTDYNLMQAHIQQEPPPLGELGVECPPELEALLGRALAKSPAGRFQSAEEFAEALAPVAHGSAGAATKATRLARVEPPPAETRMAVQPVAVGEASVRKLPRGWLVAGVGALVVLAGLAAWITPGRGRGPDPAAESLAAAPATAASPATASGAPPSEPEPAAEPTPPATGASQAVIPGLPSSSGAAGAAPAPGAGRDVLSIGRDATDRKQAAKSPAPRSIRGVRKLYIESMANSLDTFIVEEIRKQMPGRLAVVADREDADAIMTGRSVKHGGSRFTAGFRDDYTGTLSVTDLDGENVLWESEAGDRKMVMGIVKHGGPKKVAERLVGGLKKAMEAKK